MPIPCFGHDPKPIDPREARFLCTPDEPNTFEWAWETNYCPRLKAIGLNQQQLAEARAIAQDAWTKDAHRC